MMYTEAEIKFLNKCLKYNKKYNKDITHDFEALLYFPQTELRMKRAEFLEMCDSIFKKAQAENLTKEDVRDWGTWDYFDIIIIDTKLTIATLIDDHYCISFKSIF